MKYIFYRNLHAFLRTSLWPGVEIENGIAKIFTIKMRVYFCCSDGFMSQHVLHCPQISSAVDQVGGKGCGEIFFLRPVFSARSLMIVKIITRVS